jgi:cysteine desulfurase
LEKARYAGPSGSSLSITTKNEITKGWVTRSFGRIVRNSRVLVKSDAKNVWAGCYDTTTGKPLDRITRVFGQYGVDDPSRLALTSGATESNNWVINAASEAAAKPGRLVTTAIEHASVLEPMRRLERKGWRLTVVPVSADGVVRLDQLQAALCPETALVSIMAANNETGVVQPICELAHLVEEHAPQALLHTDATQMVGKIPFSLEDGWARVDFLSLSGHKFHGPKGIGALFIREGLELSPLLLGGGQEDGLRSGTSDVPSIVGLGAAADLANDQSLTDQMRALRDEFERDLAALFPDVVIHCRHVARLPNTSCFSLPGCDGNHLAEALAQEGVCVGTGSACSSGALHPPKSLLEMGVEYGLAAGTLRVSLSRYSTVNELDVLLRRLAKLRESSRLAISALQQA